MKKPPCASSWRNTILNRWDIARIDAPIRTSKERQAGNIFFLLKKSIGFKNDLPGKEDLGRYICTVCPDDREMPGFEGVVAKWDRNKHGENTKEQRKSKKETFVWKKPLVLVCQLLPYNDLTSHLCNISYKCLNPDDSQDVYVSDPWVRLAWQICVE